MGRIGRPNPRAGRTATPPALQALRNFPNHAPVRTNLLQPPAFDGDCPTRLRSNRHAVDYWDRYAPLYRQLGTLTTLSAPAFEQLCETWGAMLELDEDILLHGRTHTTKNRGECARPQVMMRHAAFDRCKFRMVDFGIGPASLTRISATTNAERDPVDAFRTAPRRSTAA